MTAPAFEVTFRIVRPQVADNGELVRKALAALACAFLADLPKGSEALPQDWEKVVERPLAAGSEVRLRLSPLQFARFFVERRKGSCSAAAAARARPLARRSPAHLHRMKPLQASRHLPASLAPLHEEAGELEGGETEADL